MMSWHACRSSRGHRRPFLRFWVLAADLLEHLADAFDVAEGALQERLERSTSDTL